MRTEYGWTGKILRVDLSGRKWWVEPTEKYAERFIGGVGIGYKILWDEVGPEVGALDPENRLVMAPGPLTGTLAPASGRFELVAKSPRSYPRETVTRSGMGGFWGPELKFAGYDALVVQGKADHWVNLWIHDDQVEFREAKDYVGKDTYETQIELRKELDPGARILCIGPAGENLSRLAVILSETSFASGRSGFGAVMGSKRLKAIAVRGTKPLKVFDSERLIEISKKARHISALHTGRERTTRIINVAERREFINKYRRKNTGCFGCPMQCFAHVYVPDVGHSAAHCINYFYHPHATRHYGSSLERDQAVADGYILANRYGLDTFEFWHMVKFLRDLYEAGSIEPQPELPLNEIGSREFIQKLLLCVATRKGIGDLLAEGSARAADRIKGGWDFCSKYFPAYGSALHGAGKCSVRTSPGIALLWALDSRCPVIDQHQWLHLSASYQTDSPPYTLSPEDAGKISQKVFGSEMAIDHSTFEFKPETAIWVQNRSSVINTLILCDWLYPAIHSFATEDRCGDTSLETQLLAAVTGYRLTEEELTRVGERIWNLARAIMVREGRTRDQDTFHEAYFRERPGEKAVPREELEKAKTRYYQLRGWNEATGRPTGKKLKELELSDIGSLLEEKKII